MCTVVYEAGESINPILVGTRWNVTHQVEANLEMKGSEPLYLYLRGKTGTDRKFPAFCHPENTFVDKVDVNVRLHTV